MNFIGYKPSSYKVAKVMERILKENNKGAVKHAFLKYAFCYNNYLIVGNHQQLVGIKTMYLTGLDNATFKQGGVYTFKVSNWSREQYCIELEEVQGVYVPNSIGGFMQFGSNPDMQLSFSCIDNWYAFNYRLATFKNEYLKDAYSVVGKYVVNEIYFNRDCNGGVGSVKVQNGLTMTIYMSMLYYNEVVKPCKLDEVLYSHLTTSN